MESRWTTAKSFHRVHHGQLRSKPCQGRRGESVGPLAPSQDCRQRPRRSDWCCTSTGVPGETDLLVS